MFRQFSNLVLRCQLWKKERRGRFYFVEKNPPRPIYVIKKPVFGKKSVLVHKARSVLVANSHIRRGNLRCEHMELF